MTKSDLIDAISTRAGLPRDTAAALVGSVFQSMTEAMERGERIEIRNFGTFVVKNYKAYTGRNPKTGAIVAVPAKRTPTFKAGLGLKNMLNE